MFAVVVAVEKGLRDSRVIGGESKGFVSHLCDRFEDYRIVSGIISVPSPAERSMAGYQAGRYGEGVDGWMVRSGGEARNDSDTGLVDVAAGNRFSGKFKSAWNWTVEVIGVGGS